MSRFCDDCGTRFSEGMCPNCNEELYIMETQILRDGTPMVVSDEFAQKLQEQREGSKGLQ